MTNLTFTGADLSWTASSSNPAGGYQWEVRDDASNVVNNGSTAGTTASTSGLTADTDYGLFVRAICGAGDTSTWAGPHPFYTGYCIPVSSSTTYYIDDFTTTGGYSNIHNEGTGLSTTGYGDFSSLSVSASAGDVISFSTQFFTTTFHFRIWVDWNKDLDFDDAVELAFDGTAYQSNYTGSITVPVGTANGNYRMRIRQISSGTPVPCGSISGEAEDYTVQVIDLPSCLSPSGLGASVSIYSATLSWTASTSAPADGYVWEVRTSGAGGSGGAGLVANGTTGAGVTTANVGGLTSNTGYTLYVRSNCSGGDLSFWAGPLHFTTIAACGDDFTDTGGPSGAYGNVENWVKTYCRTTPGDQVRVLFSSFNTQASYDKLFIFNGPDVNAPKFASTNGNGFDNTTYGAGGWWGDLSASLPGPFVSSNASGCLTFAFVSNSSTTNSGWTATTSCETLNNTCAAATAVLCGNTYSGVTAGVPHSMPASACPFNGAESTGGQNWYLYTGGATDEAVTLSTCGQANFDTRISVFTGADCNSLGCVSFADDNLGCAGGSSEMTFTALAGTSYWIAVHGAGAEEGSYQLTITCTPPCAAPANDDCANAVVLPNTGGSGSGTPTPSTNICASVDAPTSCSGALPVQGVWFSFNSGNFDIALITLLDNGENSQYSASTLDYALYTGTCAGLGATGSVACEVDAAGTNVVNVTPNTDYLLLVYNTGGAGVEGTFGVKVEHPQLDAAITAIIDPAPGIYCSSVMAPQVTLLNNGNDNLTSVQITFGLSGGVNHIYNWTGNLVYGASVNVTLPTVIAEFGAGQTLTVSTSLPNGLTDAEPGNDSQSILLDVGGEGVVVNIMTDDNPGDLDWFIFDAADDFVASGGGYTQANTLISEQHCLSTENGNCFKFLLVDGFGDGICCANGNGYWELRTPTGGLLLRDLFEGGDASPSSSPANPNYGFGHNICLPAGPANIAPTECGLFNNMLGNKVYANKVTGASNYQFEFSDPDAGFMRRIARPYNYVHFWDMVTNPLVPGVKYFARVRTDRDGPMQ
ncbi:MAG: GEVED domain-containing protein, partial [Flavobacteriales bacterium]